MPAGLTCASASTLSTSARYFRRSSGPLAWRRDESFLDTVGEQVAEAGDDGVVIEDRDHSRSPGPERARPIVEPAQLTGDVAVDVAEERSQLCAVAGGTQQVVVVGEIREGVQEDLREQHEGAAEDADDEVARTLTRTQ